MDDDDISQSSATQPLFNRSYAIDAKVTCSSSLHRQEGKLRDTNRDTGQMEFKPRLCQAFREQTI